MTVEDKSKIHELLKSSARNFPDKKALCYKDREYTYAQLQTLVEKISRYIISITPEGDVVSLYMENSDYWVACYFAILSSGCVVNPIGLRTSQENILSYLEQSRTKTLLVSSKLTEKCKRLGLDKYVKIICIEDILTFFLGENEPARSDYSYATLMYTSGSTGAQKAILLPHSVVLNATTNIVDYLKINYNDIYYCILPLSHSFGLGNVHSIFKVGGIVIVADNTINLKKILQEICEFKVTLFAAVPQTLKLITENFLDDFVMAGDFLRVICTNTGPMPVEITKEIISRLKKTSFITYYGLTEASRSTFMHFNLYPDKLESVGRPAPNVEIKIVDENNHSLPPFEKGEICIRGSHVIKEYWENETMTNLTFKDGWMHTGDFGYLDDKNFLYFVGRNDDLVNISGEKVSLAEIDNVLMQVNEVQDAAALENQDAATEKCIVALVVSKEGAHLQEFIRENVLSHCKKNLDSYKIPREIVFVNSIPRTDSGKIKRNELRRLHNEPKN